MKPRLAVIGAVSCVWGCAPPPIPYLTLSGTIHPPSEDATAYYGSGIIDLISLKRDLGRTHATEPNFRVGRHFLTYSVQIDSQTLPNSPTLFKVTLRSPDTHLRGGPLLSTLVRLWRPVGPGPDLGVVQANIDSTSSLAALGIEFRATIDPEIRLERLNTDKVARHLDKNALLVFNFVQASRLFIAQRTDVPPAANSELAQQVSEDLPRELIWD